MKVLSAAKLLLSGLLLVLVLHFGSPVIPLFAASVILFAADLKRR